MDRDAEASNMHVAVISSNAPREVSKEQVARVRSLLSTKASLTGEGKEDQNENDNGGGIILARGLTKKAFCEWAETKKFGFSVCFVRGDVYAKEVPNRPHAFCQSEISRLIQNQNHAMDHIEVGTSQDIPSNLSEDVQIPDIVLNVLGRFNIAGVEQDEECEDYPAVIIEIGVAQSAVDLYSRSTVYLGPDLPCCQVYIAIKRYDHRISGEQGMVAWVFYRHVSSVNPVRVISFGTGALASPVIRSLDQKGWLALVEGVGIGAHPPCDAAAIPNYQINVPTGLVFAQRQGGVPAGVPAFYSIDLFLVQQALIKKLRNYKST